MTAAETMRKKKEEKKKEDKKKIGKKEEKDKLKKKSKDKKIKDAKKSKKDDEKKKEKKSGFGEKKKVLRQEMKRATVATTNGTDFSSDFRVSAVTGEPMPVTGHTTPPPSAFPMMNDLTGVNLIWKSLPICLSSLPSTDAAS